MESSDDSSSRAHTPPIASSRPVPRFVFVFYLIDITLHSFVFYSIWSRIVAFVRDYYVKEDPSCARKDAGDFLPTLTAQIFLIANYMAPIAGGLVSDIKYTRYDVIFVSRVCLSLGLAITITLTNFVNAIPNSLLGYLIGVMVFILASSSGISLCALFIFGVEQLQSYADVITRQSFRRLVCWFFLLGKILSQLLSNVDGSDSLAHPRLLSAGIILLASLLMIPIFVACKRFYRFNELSGARTLKNFKNAIWHSDTVEESWSLTDNSPEVSDELIIYQRTLLRRSGLLILIFFTFGAFYTGDYFAGIIYPFQESLNSHTIYTNNYVTSGGFLLIIPIIELVIRQCGWYGSKVNFYFIGFGMLLSLISITMSDFKADSPERTLLKQVLSDFSQYCFYPPGFDLADIEAPSTLRGTSTGLFVGLGTFFGGCIYLIWLFIPPIGVNAHKWLYARIIVGSIMGMTLLLYVATAYLYHKAKSDYSQARQHVPSECLEDSITRKTQFA